ncbi:hypothetical protein [Antribacter gilvus]|uniref:hypothetical protein n=1 Tax=Antribacter gilvus TaxID=2304675 RepID=UPI000F7819B8|nr:hypothetical protein [Antribacter gilvus]
MFFAAALVGAGLLVWTGYVADASGGSLPTWRFVVPWAVFFGGVLGTGASGIVVLVKLLRS